MASLAQGEHPSSEPSKLLAAAYGFLPSLFWAQAGLPAALEAESRLINAIVLQSTNLSKTEKNGILSAVGGAQENRYTYALHRQQNFDPISPLIVKFAGK